MRRGYGSGSLRVRGSSYYGRWHQDGRWIERKLGNVRAPGTKTDLTKAMAEKLLREEMAKSVEPVLAVRLTFGEVAERFLVHRESMGRKASTMRSYRSLLGSQLLPHFGPTLIQDIDRRAVESFQRLLLTGGRNRPAVQPKTAKNSIGLLSVILAYAIREGWLGQNPCGQVDRPKIDKSDDIRFFTLEQVEVLLRSLPATQEGRWRQTLYLAAVMSGLRRGELLGLRWRDVDWTAGRIRVHQSLTYGGGMGTPKSGKGRSVPLADRLAAALDALHQESAFRSDSALVFGNPETGDPRGVESVSRQYGVDRERAGLPPVTFHELRHTFGTTMAAAGVPIRTLQEWMGHAQYATTEIYAHYSPSAREAEMVNTAFAPASDLAHNFAHVVSG